MARYTGPSCRLCRREGVKLFIKGTKCTGAVCPMNTRTQTPGQHGNTRGKPSNYALQLREKQKVKRMYGVLEKQFKLYFKKAEHTKAVTGEKLLELLERRLDNVVFRLGFAPSRAQARQIVRHRHILVNDKKVNIPSFIVKVGDVVKTSEKPNIQKIVKENLEILQDCPVPG